MDDTGAARAPRKGLGGIDLDALANIFFRIGSGGSNRPLAVIERKYMRALPFVVLVMLVSTALEGASIGLIIPLLTVMMAGRSSLISDEFGEMMQRIVGEANRLYPGHAIEALAIAMVGLLIIKAVVLTLGWLVISRIDGFAQADVRNAVARKLLRVPYRFYIVHEYSKLVNIISNDTWRTGQAIQAIYGIAGALAATIVLGALAAYASWRLFLVVLVGAVIARLLQQALGKRMEQLSEQVSSANEKMGERMLATIDFARMLRLFNQQGAMTERFYRASDDLRRILFNSEKLGSVFGPVMEIVQAVLFVLVLLLAQRFGMTLPEIIAFLALQYRLQPQILAVTQGVLDLSALAGSIRNTEWLLGQPDEVHADAAYQPISAIDQPIRFEQLSYQYPDGDGPVVIDASFTLPIGRATALIGRSGAGKSTLINLLTRLIEPDRGRILHGDTPVTAYDPDAWRARIALAGQDIDLIEGSVADNIAFGAPGVTRADVEEAARLADAHDFIAAMGGYDARISAFGANLSGGQRQRIGLARALARRPSLLILDEATNAVDGLSEGTIIELLTEHRRFGTAVVISHRRSTLNACENGIVIEGGRVVEQGPLRALDFYHRMEKLPELDGSAT
ncbi:MAG: ABC transporter ATP-binding protein/permease [Sphingomonas sp.]|uniref:ABC transporter ATP-binding protein n=1 Tax=Sphingomonas sp. TaxID=28214 RepID=UPI0025E252BD|nr:ABC transporter ATP-binding protein [Sphingomonas sp.]MBX9881862.1 ABC transporter ATP-binding protein/permease [Sphingomonas sp.]